MRIQLFLVFFFLFYFSAILRQARGTLKNLRLMCGGGGGGLMGIGFEPGPKLQF